MTAPLPQLPEWAKGSCWEKDVRDYAKLAVREALERAASQFEGRWSPDDVMSFRSVTAKIRAMIEEYK